MVMLRTAYHFESTGKEVLHSDIIMEHFRQVLNLFGKETYKLCSIVNTNLCVELSNLSKLREI